MGKSSTTAYVGLDVHKGSIDIALAEAEYLPTHGCASVLVGLERALKVRSAQERPFAPGN